MSTTFAIGDLLTARLNFSLTGLPDVALNVLHYSVTSLSGAPTDIFDALSNCGEAIHEHFFDAWAAAASQDVEFESVTVTDVHPTPRSTSVTFTGIGDVAGTIVSPTMPLQNAPTILKKTALGGRKGYGRLFFVGWPQGWQTGGIINAERINDLDNMASKVSSTISVAGTGWTAVLTPVLVNGPEDSPNLLTVIKQASLASEVLRAQRRRQPGKGS